MSNRINARLHTRLSARVARVRRLTGKTTTEIIQEALEAYVDQLDAHENVGALFQKAGFTASGKGPNDLAKHAKRYLTQSLERKK